MMMVFTHAEERGDRWHDIGSGPYRGEGWHDGRGEEWHDDDGGTYSSFSRKKLIIYLATVYLIWLWILPSLPLMRPKASLIIVDERLIRLMNIDYLVGDNNRLFIESWHLWKASHRLFCRWNFRMNVFFSVYYFASSVSILFSATIIHCDTLVAVR